MNDMNREFEQYDFFRTNHFVDDPYSYFDYLRQQGPAVREPHQGIVMVTGFEEALAVYNDPENFSSCMSTTGPMAGCPIPLEGHENEDISELIEEYRDRTPFSDQLPTMDPPVHSDHRALLMRLITPLRLKQNEEYMWQLADQQIDTFISSGKCEFMGDFAGPFAVLVISDLLGVPPEDRQEFRKHLLRQEQERGGAVVGGVSEKEVEHLPLAWLYDKFSGYIEDRRQNPRGDVMTRLAEATFPDGSVPQPLDVARIAANLFAAGQETTVRLLSYAFQQVGERPDLQRRLREDRKLIPNFVEECLRHESPIKGDFRLAKRPTTLGGLDIPAGTFLFIANGAANRDPRMFERPDEFQLDRANAKLHVAFGRGRHTCPGAPLARAETVVSLNRFFDRTSDIRISEDAHGPRDARRYGYLPTFILRGLTHLGLEFDPVSSS
ncbi:cytochrome P450 [Novosphingobium endophyticum]|uniref:Cytochrome P450 n=1 Tax=Novosphingobium endophyticum TaxID=1955250 RepID=A0A916TV63_9SPHN|nr:cytochrome P450 [Novosphingobium endophyticum]GGC14028.1 cytochrome P450 [Novosphingobium endophyticum]